MYKYEYIFRSSFQLPMCIVGVCISTVGVGEGIVTRKCNENEINQTEKIYMQLVIHSKQKYKNNE